MDRIIRPASAALFAVALFAASATAQQERLPAGLDVARLEAEPASIELRVGESTPLSVTAYDANGDPIDAAVRVSGPRSALTLRGGRVIAAQPGEFDVVATVMLPADAERTPPTLEIPVRVRWPAVERVEIEPAASARLYEGTTLGHRATARHADGTTRPEPRFEWSSSDPSVATVDRFGAVTAHAAGAVTITARLDGAEGSVDYRVAPLPATGLEITGGAPEARTGDVLSFDARATDASGDPVADLPITWSFSFVPDDSIHAPGAGARMKDGSFVARVAGRYTILASAGPLQARRTVDVRPRDVIQRVRAVGHGRVSHVHTSDLWVFEGNDGRDYAFTGTWGGDGWAYVWDVTDPASIAKTDSVQVDARTVNDVKVSPDGRYAALSREGASNRRNGVVILDLSDPAHPTIASTYDEGLTGGVHNMFATEDHLFALSAGDKYVILDVTDLTDPRYVSEYNHPDSRVHDVWVHDGIAYSSEWKTGVVVVDVGNGRWGGSIDDPVFVTNIPYPVGRTHAAFPYYQESTGRFYLFLGDEILNRAGRAFEGSLSVAPYDPETGQGGTPSASAGYMHIIDFTDPENPKDVARYHVPQFGTHNFWVKDDKLYIAYYEGGLRVVDVSGELMGNLADQGREIAVYKAFDPVGFIANAPMAWGPQPHKGHVFFSDFNSGLWSVKLEPRDPPESTT